MADIALRYRNKDSANKYHDAVTEMEKSIWKYGWDGEWFKRAYDAAGEPVGSKVCDEGKIFIEPQGICVMAGLGTEDGSARKAMDAVAENLATDHGIVLQQPAYTRYYLNLGEISSYPPGYKENAGIFCHTNPWIMIAEAMLGNNNKALDYYLRINPSAREEISEVHKSEPYVYAQMIAGKDAPTHGEAKNSWLTGTAAWNFVAVSQWILGIRPDYDGLIINPVIPDEWQGFEASRKFRGVTYQITAKRQGLGNQITLLVNDQPIDGICVPAQSDLKKPIEVTVLVGSSA
jgi:cellobiose phosphorylase